MVADFSAIEARVIAWLAGEQWRLDLFRCGGDIYCQSASQMFGVPVEKHGKNADLRQKGKVTELACGFGGSIGALTAMGALDRGLAEGELKLLVDAWRAANPQHRPTVVGCRRSRHQHTHHPRTSGTWVSDLQYRIRHPLHRPSQRQETFLREAPVNHESLR